MSIRRLYSALWFLSLPLVVMRLWWKGRRQPAYRRHLAERFGRYAQPRTDRCVWIHAVSVGETRAAQPLVRALRGHDPALHILFTHMTPTGRETAQALYADADDRIHSVYLPYDLGYLHARFLRHFRPLAGIVMETEVWPNLMARADRDRCPMLLVNGRLSQRSFARYLRFGALAREAFGGFAVIGAQSPADAQRFTGLGARRVEVTGNIKFDNHPADAQVALGRQFRARIGDRPVVLAASTREGEEADLLDVAGPLIASGALLAIVPRHPQRFDAVAQLAEARGYRVGRRSRGDGPDAGDQVWLGDSMGEMTAYYTLADVVLMGGTWRPLGGQNFIECCAVGTPVVLGPSTFNFAQAAEQALEAGAAVQCADLNGAVDRAMALLNDPSGLNTMGTAALAFAQAHGGATERTLALITPWLSGAAPASPVASADSKTA
ncbi:3-deoxy-D-manno-octulosonic acid transferase [Nitrogeniibacter mangrovi]|uniref:3-deoxy-D-manno-octulosonic acid transferase n=1 Tax=Nitrogeniibacter mangrovi TaxID=2016596 RepID=A0A6C1B237_9RHOO|nr:lipid IV(A) 3-deoxy-D-manno-octulosonic acid transferase [Nitrogeniibacter mangrovi]QID16965.1 3-deoxy-D-manno-octulosonic acid transferase [Nitrogeniibacter mangrovi]